MTLPAVDLYTAKSTPRKTCKQHNPRRIAQIVDTGRSVLHESHFSSNAAKQARDPFDPIRHEPQQLEVCGDVEFYDLVAIKCIGLVSRD